MLRNIGEKKDIAVLLNNIGQVASNVAQHWRRCPQCCATLGRIFEIVDFAELIQNSDQKKKRTAPIQLMHSLEKKEPKKGKNKRKHPKVRRQCCATFAPLPNVAQHSGAKPELGICFVFQRQLPGASGHVHRAHGSVVPSEACAVLSGVAAPPRVDHLMFPCTISAIREISLLNQCLRRKRWPRNSCLVLRALTCTSTTVDLERGRRSDRMRWKYFVAAGASPSP